MRATISVLLARFEELMFDSSVWQRTRRAVGPALAVLAVMLVATWGLVGFPCTWLGVTYGVWTQRCPTGTLRLDVEAVASGLVRGHDDGRLVVSPHARWLVGDDRDAVYFRDRVRRGVAMTAELLDADDNVVATFPRDGFRRDRSSRVADLALPDLPDGDYVLRVQADAGFDARTVDLDVPLYTPALLHVMTDRPLYKPGQTVKFRAVALARTDRQPIEDRPGRWTVVAPGGLEMLSERSKAGAWGIAQGTFPLDAAAETGTWAVTWTTGDDEVTAKFEVRRFSLPRLTVQAAPTQAWVGPSERLRFRGRATFTSGAPVAGGTVDARLRLVDGRWPIPLDWEEPRALVADSDGRFTVDYGRVPVDLMDRTTLALSVSVTDVTGETAYTSATTVLSPESLHLDAVTELGDGVVGGFNNRVYVRVATPDGTPLPDTTVTLRRPTEAEPMATGTTDASGVVAVQLDPGDPITVVDKAAPVRRRPLQANPVALPVATRTGGEPLDLRTRRALDALHPAIARCGLYTVGDRDVPVGVRIDDEGRLDDVMAPPDVLGSCLARVMRRWTLPDGPTRTYALTWRVPDSQHPSLRLAHEHVYGNGIDAFLDDVGLRARRCLPFGRGRQDADIARVHWSVDAGSTEVDTVVEPLDRGGLPGWAWRCVRDNFLGRTTLDEPVKQAAMGATTVYLRVPSTHDGPPPQDTTRTAYALEVAARDADNELVGEGRLVMPVGNLPDLRLRATPALTTPGSEVTVELLRGPGFVGHLPTRLELRQGSAEVAEAPVDDKQARFTIPDDVTGFLTVEHRSGRAIVFVRPDDPLSVEVTSDRESYRPGDTATLTVSTTSDGTPEASAVGLSGVDATLAALARLPDPTDLGRATVRATAVSPAFGKFNPVALALGQVEGENAAMATVLRVTNLPWDPAGDEPVSAATEVRADVDSPLTLGFYRALEKTVELVRAWEESAPPEEMLTPERMVAFWSDALEALDDAGEPAVDGFERPLTLAVLPMTLLEQVDPRKMPVEGTRLSEDVVNWVAYVDAEGRLP